MGLAYKMKMSTKPQIGLEFSDVEFPALLERLRGAGDLVQDVKEVGDLVGDLVQDVGPKWFSHFHSATL